MFVKSPLNYIGGKYKLLNELFYAFPRHINIFVDLFAGGFNVGINANANKIICNDFNSDLIEMYKYFKETETDVLLRQIKERVEEYNLTDTNEDGYKKFRDFYNKHHDIVDLFVLICYSFNNQIRFNNKHEFNMPFGKNRSYFNPKIEENLINFCQALKEKNIEFISQSFSSVNLDILGENDFVYCDPPYLISSSPYNDGTGLYKGWSEKEEKQLLEKLDELSKRNVKFALSNVFYHKGEQNGILIEWSKNYNVLYLNKTYSNCNYHLKNKDAKTVEVLVLNYTPETQFFF